MRLVTLLQNADLDPQAVEPTASALEIRAVHADSRRVVPGSLFVVRDGLNGRGIDYVPDALRVGAVALVVTPRDALALRGLTSSDQVGAQPVLPPATSQVWDAETRTLLTNIPLVCIASPRRALGALASAIHGHPSRRLRVVALTGTNGKTTTATLIAQLLNAAGHRAAALGTLGLWTPEGIESGGLTTPDAVDLQARLADLVRRDFSVVVLEASSHALDQGRLVGTRIAVAGWTNLSRDHLDYHGDVASYQAAKTRLFTELLPVDASAWVNADDPAPASMLGRPGVRGYSLVGAPAADAQVAGLRLTPAGLSCRLHLRPAASATPVVLDLQAPLLGRHNAHNVTLAALICHDLGLSATQIELAVRSLSAPRGRLEPVANPLGALILVDYAHTPDALAQVLAMGRELVAPGAKLFVVFGCGGDRDAGKRAPMGQVAGEAAEVSFATSDNPRGEDPSEIIAAIAVGLDASGARRVERLVPSTLATPPGPPSAQRDAIYCVDADRDSAIRRAIGLVQPGDVLIIAGKGHETTQTIGTEVRPFDDAAVARRWLRQRKRAPSVPVAAHAQAAGDHGPTHFAFDALSAAAATGGEVIASQELTSSEPASSRDNPEKSAAQWTTTLTTDSRHISPGALFVPLVGDRFDGHAYLAPAAAQGATGLLCAQDRTAALRHVTSPRGPWLVAVKDTLVALGDLARAHRRQFEGPVVCITGSNGKTSTKELTALTLGAAGPVLATHKNHNNRIGVPQTLAKLRRSHRFAVVECGMSVPGEIAELGRIAEPDVAVLTNISAAHLAGLGSIAGVAAEKAALLAALGHGRSPGVAIIPADEPLLIPHLQGLTCRIIGVGSGPDADVRVAGDVQVIGLHQRFTAVVCGERVVVALPAIGQHMVRNALTALAIAHVLGVNLQAAAWALAAFKPVGQRMRPLQLGERLILEDCYNANPASVQVALTTLASLPGPRVAVLGDMLELGSQAPELHAEIGAAAAREGIDLLLARGEFAAHTVRGARKSGLAAAQVFTTDAAAADLLATRNDMTILVKGSRGAHMEGVIDALRLRCPETPHPTTASLAGAVDTQPEADRAALAL